MSRDSRLMQPQLPPIASCLRNDALPLPLPPPPCDPSPTKLKRGTFVYKWVQSASDDNADATAPLPPADACSLAVMEPLLHLDVTSLCTSCTHAAAISSSGQLYALFLRAYYSVLVSFAAITARLGTRGALLTAAAAHTRPVPRQQLVRRRRRASWVTECTFRRSPT